VEKYSRADQAKDENILRRFPFACWITKATDTHSKYVKIVAFFTATMVTQTRHSVKLLYIVQLVTN